MAGRVWFQESFYGDQISDLSRRTGLCNVCPAPPRTTSGDLLCSLPFTPDYLEKFLMSLPELSLISYFWPIKIPPGRGVVRWHETKVFMLLWCWLPSPCSHSHLLIKFYLFQLTPEIIQPDSVYPQALALDCVHSLSHWRHISVLLSKARQRQCARPWGSAGTQTDRGLSSQSSWSNDRANEQASAQVRNQQVLHEKPGVMNY